MPETNDKIREVLLVEDNDAHARLIYRICEESVGQLRLHRAGTLASALEYVKRCGRGDERSPLPDLVVLDVRLPDGSGLAVLEAVREKRDLRAVPVVVLTSSDLQSDLEHAYAGCANSVITKPVDFSRFFEMLKAVMDYWLRWNTVPH